MDSHLYETRFTDKIGEESAEVLEGIALLSFMGTLLVMMTQGLLWFKHGIWPSFNTLEVLSPYLPNIFLGWLENPQSMNQLSELLLGILDVELYLSLLGNGILAYILYKLFNRNSNSNRLIEERDIRELSSENDWQKDL